MKDIRNSEALAPFVVEWNGVRSDQVDNQTVSVAAFVQGAAWRIESFPWWLAARRVGDCLVLRPRNCGRLEGTVSIASNQGQAMTILARTVIRPTLLQAAWTVCKLLALGAAGVVLGVILGFFCGIAIPLLGGPPGVALAGAVFCDLWGAVLGGRAFAARCRIVALPALLIAAIAVVCLVLVGSHTVGDLPAFRGSLALGGLIVGGALGAVTGGRRWALFSATIGLLSWFAATFVALPPFAEGPIGPATFLGLVFTPGLGLGLWGILMGVALAPLPRQPQSDAGHSDAPERGAVDELLMGEDAARIRRSTETA